jgi:hypothetical protein
MHLTCIRAVERAHVIFVRPGRKQDEGDIFTVNRKIPLTPTLSRRERGFRVEVHFVADSYGLTVKFVPLLTIPPEVATPITPLVAPLGT